MSLSTSLLEASMRLAEVRISRLLPSRADAEFREEDHARGPDGKFIAGGGVTTADTDAYKAGAGRKTVGGLIKHLLQKGHNEKAILETAVAHGLDPKHASHIAWYRNDLKRKGQLGEKGGETPPLSAKEAPATPTGGEGSAASAGAAQKAPGGTTKYRFHGAAGADPVSVVPDLKAHDQKAAATAVKWSEAVTDTVEKSFPKLLGDAKTLEYNLKSNPKVDDALRAQIGPHLEELNIATLKASWDHGARLAAIQPLPEAPGAPTKVVSFVNAFVKKVQDAHAAGPVEDLPTHTSQLSKTGGQLGSNPGGQYHDVNGKKYYVKEAKSAAHAANEITAGHLYKAAGAPITNAHAITVQGGKAGTISKWETHEGTFDPNNAEHVAEARQHFGTHAWLANWDAIGLENDNQVRIGGKFKTVDAGGAMKFRAQGGPKAFGPEVAEFHTLRDKKMGPQAARVFAGMSDAEIRDSVARVKNVSDDTIRQIVAEHMPDDPGFADTLIARKHDLAKKAGI